jgi:hypothetical protein
MPDIAYPQELKKTFWDKKKGALDGAADLDTALKTLEKKHDTVTWSALGCGWTKAAAGDAAKLKALYEGLDKLYRTKATPLKLEALSVASTAEKAAKAKDAAKPLKDACALIVKAAQAYAKAVASGLDELEAEFTQAAKAMPASKGKDDGDDDDEPSSALADPKRLYKQLQLCKADPSRRVNFAMVDDGKQDPVLVLHPRLAGRGILAKLIKDLGINKGAFGQLSLNGMVLQLVVEKKVSGLTKRIRIPIRQCGFKIGKVMQLDEKGQSLEEDLDEESEAPETQSQEVPTAPPSPGGASGAGAALQGWTKAREAAILVLKEAAKDIAALKDPESAKAVIEISAVVKNLTAEPRTASQVAELIRYIDKDDVVLDVSDFVADVRTPLLKALAQLHRAVTA